MGLIDKAEVQRAWSVLVEPGQVVEVRVLEAELRQNSYRTETLSGYFDNSQSALQALQTLKSAMGIYVTLQICKKNLLSRACNRLKKAGSGKSATDRDMLRYRWLLIDSDIHRDEEEDVSGISSTDEEHAEALAHSRKVAEALHEQGWPDPVIADSGNGGHLLYRIDLPTSDSGLVERVLKGLAERYNTSHIHIDCTVFNPARICKLYGTLACKGDNTPDRPHRTSRLLEVPERIEVVSRELLEAAALSEPVQPSQTALPETEGSDLTGEEFMLEFCQKYGIRLKEPQHEKGYTSYVLVDGCVFDASHAGKDAALIIGSRGGIKYHCFHNSCANKDWRAFRKHFDRDAYTKTSGGARSKKTEPDTWSTPEPKDGRPAIVMGRQLHEIRDETLEALRDAHTKEPKLFVYLSTICKITHDEDKMPIIQSVTVAGMRNELTDIADFYSARKGPHVEGTEFKNILPPKELAEQILALAPSEWPLLPLKGLVQTPVLRADGTILDTPGYDKQTQLYYLPSKGMARCKIPDNPTKQDAQMAMAFLKKIFADFPFEAQADRANALGFLLTPFVRYAVKRDVQMALIDANNPGTGKGYIVSVVSIAATGEEPEPMAAKFRDEEWEKAILAKLMKAPRMVVIDNIRGTLTSQYLELTLTGKTPSGRILGQSKDIAVKNNAIWVATGNNLLIGGDLPRRCYRIRLLSNTSAPEERTDFQIPDLLDWMYKNRPEVVSAILTVARAWYAAGKPKTKNVPNLGGFTEWAQTVGSMLEFAGVEGFQGNRDALRSKNNEEAQEWEAFLRAMEQAYGKEWVFNNKIAETLVKAHRNKKLENENQPSANALLDALPRELKKPLGEKPDTFEISLAIQLGKRVQTVYGTDGLALEREVESHTKAKRYRVVRKVAEGSLSPALSENFFEKNDNCDSDSKDDSGNIFHWDGDTNYPPLPSAPSEHAHTSDQPNTASHGSPGQSAEEEAQWHDPPLAEGWFENAEGSPEEVFRSLFAAIRQAFLESKAEEAKWDAPGSGYDPGPITPDKYLKRLWACWESGDAQRIQAAKHAMHNALNKDIS